MHFLHSESRLGRAAELDATRLRRIEQHRTPLAERYEALAAAALAELVVDPGDAVIDVGAGFGGLTAHFAAQVGTTGRVIAFEPLAPLRRDLRAALATSCQGRVDIRAQLPARHGGETEAQLAEPVGLTPRTEAVFHPGFSEPGTPPMLSTCRLDDLDAAPVTLIHFGVRGMALDALHGATRLLQEQRPVVTFFVPTRSDGRSPAATREALLRLCDENRYTVRDVTGCHLGVTRWQATELRRVVAVPVESADRGLEIVTLAAADASWRLLAGDDHERLA